MTLEARLFTHLGRIALLAVVAIASSAGDTRAQGKKKATRTYSFVVSQVDLSGDIPKELATLVREQLTRAIDDHPRLSSTLPADAPDPKADPKAFSRYVKKHRLAAYRVNVELTQYGHAVKPVPGGRGQRLEVSLALRTFGETIPQRVMAFSGEGSATIRMDIGKKLRDRDSKVANKDAAELAVADALRVSLERLEAQAKGGKKTKRRRRPKK